MKQYEPDAVRTKTLGIRLTSAELKDLRIKAKKEQMSIATYIRRILFVTSKNATV